MKVPIAEISATDSPIKQWESLHLLLPEPPDVDFNTDIQEVQRAARTFAPSGFRSQGDCQDE